MRPQERFLTALRGEESDEVPVSLAIGGTNSAKWIGGTDWRAVYQAHRAVGSIFTYEHVYDPVFTEIWKNGRREHTETSKVTKIKGSYMITRQITMPQGTLTSRELVDQPEYLSGQTVEPLLKTRDDYQVYLAYVAEWLDQVEVAESEQIKVMVDEIEDEGVCTWWMTHTYYKYFWVLPELKMLTARASEDKFVGFHLTGKVHAIMPIMLEAEPDFILRFESPRFGGDCSLRETKETWGDKVCIMGGYDPHVFTPGTREDMRKETIR